MDEANVFGSAYNTSERRNYAIQQTKVNILWREGYYGEGIKIGVVDTGIEESHEMLKGKILCGKNFSADGSGADNIVDYHYHGTAVSGLICGNYMNWKCYGIAPKSKLIVAKSMNTDGKGSLQAIADGINYCVEKGADIINCSVGSEGNSTNLENAVRNAVSKGISVVVSSGNDGHNDLGDIREISYPAGYDDSICVGAIDMNYKIAGFSNSNEYVDIVAGGVDILTSYIGNRYAYVNGTSFSAPIITGIMALLKQKFMVDFQRIPSESELYGELMKVTRLIEGLSRQCQGSGYPDLSIKRIKRL